MQTDVYECGTDSDDNDHDALAGLEADLARIIEEAKSGPSPEDVEEEIKNVIAVLDAAFGNKDCRERGADLERASRSRER